MHRPSCRPLPPLPPPRAAVPPADGPSRFLETVAVTGSYGKTTVSWLVRGILEQQEQLVGLFGTVEYALAEVRACAGAAAAVVALAGGMWGGKSGGVNALRGGTAAPCIGQGVGRAMRRMAAAWLGAAIHSGTHPPSRGFCCMAAA